MGAIFIDVTCRYCKMPCTIMINTIVGDIVRGGFVGANEYRRIYHLPCGHYDNLSGSHFRSTLQQVMPRNDDEVSEKAP